MTSSTAIHRSCPVCDADQASPWIQKGELRIVACSNCSMWYANPVAPEFASGEYYDQAGAVYYTSTAKLESDYAPVRYQRELRLFRQHCPKGLVLDVGCSSGAFLFQLNQRFPGDYETLGTDVSGAPLDYAESRGIKVMRGAFPELDFGGRQPDAITFWAVLEHLVNPAKFLDKAWSILKPNGLCFVLVPNMSSLAFRLLGWRYRYVYLQHLNYFTAQTLRKLVEKKFSVVEVRTTHFNPIVVWQDWRRRGREVTNPERAQLLQRTTSYKQNPLFKPLKLAYHLTEATLSGMNLADNLAMVLRKST